MTLRRNGTALKAPQGKAAAILLALAPAGDAVPVRELLKVIATASGPPSDNAVRQHVGTLRGSEVPIVAGPRGKGTYSLDFARCRVDALEFVAGVEAEEPVDALLALWRGPVDEAMFRSKTWAPVRKARTRLLQRIERLPEAERASLTELARFAALFPDDPEVHPVRPSGRGSKPLLLVVEDNPDIMREICEQLSTYYRLLPVTGLREWRTLLAERPESLDGVQGALVDLHLTSTLDDQRGLHVLKYLRQKTDILAALVTANAMESSDYRNQERKAEFRLVAIVNKKESDWWNALEIAAQLLVGEGDAERRHRLETRLETAYRFFRREHQNNDAGRQLERCKDDYATVIGLVKVGPLERATAEVARFCKAWPSFEIR
ncbi:MULTISPECIES: hypothetical protein [unclassified Actinomadura]|uniref:hypothetical protein n=1 Tax=unclassified Actinomadura TaxID=2626254 RepID=UPI0011EE39B9|nr:hypothetical protein [Actinomadura sp. K4S16]